MPHLSSCTCLLTTPTPTPSTGLHLPTFPQVPLHLLDELLVVYGSVLVRPLQTEACEVGWGVSVSSEEGVVRGQKSEVRGYRTLTFFVRPGELVRLLVGGQRLHLQNLVDLAERHQPESSLLERGQTRTHTEINESTSNGAEQICHVLSACP